MPFNPTAGQLVHVPADADGVYFGQAVDGIVLDAEMGGRMLVVAHISTTDKDYSLAQFVRPQDLQPAQGLA